MNFARGRGVYEEELDEDEEVGVGGREILGQMKT